mmetsp:Transcript_7987/g.11884  ORF Transcript_7987/g.11884 Transcript_7987/m.11884 type:complete len:209 (-) Transcript_7987:231-857(-)
MKIATFVLSTLALALSHDSSIIAAVTAPEAVSLVEENTEERAAAQVPVNVINFDNSLVNTPYLRNDATGIYFANTVVYTGDGGSESWSMAAHSKTQFGCNTLFNTDPIKMECYGGFMQVKSVRLAPIPYISPAIFKFTITGYDENNAKSVVKTVSLDGNTMKKAKRVQLGKTFKKVSSVTFEVDGGALVGLDDIKVKIRAKKPCLNKP